ncbi:unnamed protein product [Alternaria alternata]
MVDRLRATAAAFTPLSTRSDTIRPLNGQEHNGIAHYNSIPASAVFPVSDTRSSPSIKTKIDCQFCKSVGRALNCCRARTDLQACLDCAELSQLLILENKKHQDEIVALREQLRQLEEETAEEKLTRLCVKSETKIVKLKSEVEKMNAEDELLKAENEELTKTLKRLEVEIKKAQPAAEFTVREAKRGKRM